MLADKTIEIFLFNDLSTFNEEKETWNPVYKGAINLHQIQNAFINFIEHCGSVDQQTKTQIISMLEDSNLIQYTDHSL